MTNAMKLLVLVMFIDTMRSARAGLIHGNDAVLKLSLLGKDEKHDRSYMEIARRLSLDANAIINDIDQCLLGECELGKTLYVRVNDVKVQINTVSTTLGTCKNNKKSKHFLRFQLNNLESSLRNLEMEIKTLYPNASGECQTVLNQILKHLERLRGCVAAAVGCMW